MSLLRGSSQDYPKTTLQGEAISPVQGAGRPVSRRGSKMEPKPLTQQSSILGERPFTQQSMNRPVTSIRPTTGVVVSRPQSTNTGLRGIPGTASRLTSAMMQQTMGRLGTGSSLAAQVNVVERPITQQGLSGLKTGMKGPQRQVQDKSYFMGLLRMRISELNVEIVKLKKEIENYTQEQATFLVYDKRVKEMASELTELQGKLADYNLLMDKLNTDTEKAEVEGEFEELQARNLQEAQHLDQLFAERQQREKEIHQLEMEIDQERHMTNNLVAAMSPTLRERYMELQTMNTQLQHQLEDLQQQMDSLNSKKSALEDELSVSQVKQEAVQLLQKLHEAEGKKASLLEEERSRGTPAQEREQLLKKVKDDNAEIATMDRQINEIQDQMRKMQQEMHLLDQDLEDTQSERHQKYRELRKREETMEEFLATFEEVYVRETNRVAELESSVVLVLQQMSNNLLHVGHLPSLEDFSVMRENLAFKESELEKSKNTVEGLTKERQQLNINLQKVEALEDKIHAEMEGLKQKMVDMKDEMHVFSDLESLRNQSERKRVQLSEERDRLEQEKIMTLNALQVVELHFDNIKKQLGENETYAQLSNLEKKWAQLEQNNFAMLEFSASKKAETDYEPLKGKVFKMAHDYNKILMLNLKKGGIA